MDYIKLNSFLTEYTERNFDNQYKPVAVGRYGIRTRESIYSKELAKDYSKNKVIFQNTLTVGMGSVQIDIGILTEDVKYSVSPAYHTYKITGINPHYLRYCLECRNQDMFERYVKRGSRQGKTIDLGRWLAYEIPVCETQKQQEIVSELDFVDSLITSRREQLTKLDELVKSRFIELFGDCLTNPKGWKTKCLEDIAEVGSSKRVFVEELQEEGIPFYRGTEVGALAEGKQIIPELFITEQHYVELCEATGAPQVGDLLMPSICPDGRIWVVNTDKPFYFKDGRVLWVHAIDASYNPVFLLYTLKDRILTDYSSIASGTTFAELKIFALKKCRVFDVPITLQNQFAAFVEQTDKSKLCGEMEVAA